LLKTPAARTSGNANLKTAGPMPGNNPGGGSAGHEPRWGGYPGLERDNIMEAATGTLLKDADYEGAMRMASAIGNEEARARVTAVVTQRVEQARPKP
jgi:hypothetical protein